MEPRGVSWISPVEPALKLNEVVQFRRSDTPEASGIHCAPPTTLTNAKPEKRSNGLAVSDRTRVLENAETRFYWPDKAFAESGGPEEGKDSDRAMTDQTGDDGDDRLDRYTNRAVWIEREVP